MRTYVRIIFKLTDKENNKDYIGKVCVYDYKTKEQICSNWHNIPFIKYMAKKFETDFNNIEFEILEYNIPHIPMEDVLKKYKNNR